MNESLNIIPDQENYRDKKAEEIREMRNLGQKLDAAHFLGDLRFDPRYQEERKIHKNILAKASNEKMAEGAISNVEVQAIITFKKINIEIAKILAGDQSSLERQSREIDETGAFLRDIKILELIKQDVKNKEDMGVDRESVLTSIKDEAEKIVNDLKELSKNWNDINANDNITDVVDIPSAISSWFDSVRDILQDRKLDSIDKQQSEKSAEYYCYEALLEEIEKDPDLLISVSIDRVVRKINDYIKSNLDLDGLE